MVRVKSKLVVFIGITVTFFGFACSVLDLFGNNIFNKYKNVYFGALSPGVMLFFIGFMIVVSALLNETRHASPFIPLFKGDDELDKLIALLTSLYNNNLMDEFDGVMRSKDGDRVKMYLAPYINKIKQTSNNNFYYMSYDEEESCRCYIAHLIVLWNL
jgi:hypothetical protein